MIVALCRQHANLYHQLIEVKVKTKRIPQFTGFTFKRQLPAIHFQSGIDPAHRLLILLVKTNMKVLRIAHCC